MYPRRLFPFAATAALALTVPPSRANADPERTVGDVREAVLAADSPDAKAATYRAYFTRVGRAGLKDLMKDEDTGIALQAGWEAHLKAIKRDPKVPARYDDIYDPAELKKFVAFLKDRTKAPVPDWWAARFTDVSAGRRAHSFGSDDPAARPKRHPSKAGPEVPDGAELEESGDDLVYSSGGRSVTFPKSEHALGFTRRYAGIVGEDRSAVAAFSMIGGRYTLSGYAGRGGRPAWTADVWGSGRTGVVSGFHDHWAEVIGQGDTLYVFGAESHGMYLEAFEAATGKVRFRFCTCYWFHWSEAWEIK